MGNRLLPFSILALIVAIIYFFIVEKDPSILQRTLNIPYDFKMTQGQNLSAFVLGGTGAVGRMIIKALAESPQFTKVTLIGRRQVTLPTPEEDKRYDKFDEKIIDFDNLSQYSDAFKDYDVGFSSLGTTRAKSGPEGFYKVDHDYVVNTAKLAKTGGVRHFHLVSSAGANPTGYFLYPRTKGEVEEELKSLGFPRLSIYRPALLLVDHREELRVGESIIRGIMRPLDFCRWMSVETSLLGKVMVANCFRKEDKPVEILDNGAINALGKSLPKEK